MAENTVNEPTKPEEQTVQPEETAASVTDNHEDEAYDAPHGAVVFAALMLLAYIGYYMFHWFEIFVMRGA